MSNVFNEYPVNGVGPYSITFEYQKQENVVVLYHKISDDTYVVQSNNDWSFENATTIQLNQAPSADYDKVRVQRLTDVNPLRATFYPGSAIRAQDLNANFEQLMMAIEEGRTTDGFLNDKIDDKIEEGYEVWLNRIDADSSYKGTPGDLVKSTTSLTIDDDHVASTKWIDDRYWDKFEETTYSTDTWEDETDDVHIPTTGAVEQRLIDLKELKGLKKVTGVMQRDQEWDATVTDDDHVATTDAIVERLDHELGSTSDAGSTWLQPGKIWIKSDTAELFYRRAEGTQWIQLDTKGDQGDIGPIGPPGNNGADGLTPEFSVGVVTASPPGSDPQVTQTGTTLQPVLNFVLPRGEEGPPGPPGTPGDGGGEILTFTAPLVKTGTTVSIDLLTIPNAP